MKFISDSYFRIARPIIHFCIIMLIFYLWYKVRLVTDLIPLVQLPIPYINYIQTMVFGLISWLAFVAIWIIKNLYTIDKPTQKYFQTFSKVRVYWLITITFIWYFWNGFIFPYGISRFVIVFWVVLNFLALFFFDQIFNYIETWIIKNSDNKILIIGSDPHNSYEIIQKIKKNFHSDTLFALKDEIKDLDLNDFSIIIVVGQFEKKALQSLYEQIRFTEIRFYHIWEWFFLEDVVYKPEYIANVIALEYKHSQLDERSLIFKRIFDITLSTFSLIILAPFFLLIGIIIKIESKWPVFYKQKRVGKWWKLFTFIKFRSMYKHMSTGKNYWWADADKLYDWLINSDKNQRQWILPKISDDPRVTKVGKFLRKSSIDELPQLFCARIGTMSLVWPRPHLPKEVDQYENWQRRLLSIKPGITGYAQVFGRDSLAFDQEAKLDLHYIRDWSIFMDIYVVLATFKVVFRWK